MSSGTWEGLQWLLLVLILPSLFGCSATGDEVRNLQIREQRSSNPTSKMTFATATKATLRPMRNGPTKIPIKNVQMPPAIIGPTVSTVMQSGPASKFHTMIKPNFNKRLPISTTPKAPAQRGPQIASNMRSRSTPTFPTRIGSNVIKALGHKAPSRVGQNFNSKFSIDAPNARTSTGPKISTRPQVATSQKAATKVGPTINTRLPLAVAPKYTSMVGQKITSKIPIYTTPKAPARRGPQIASNMRSGTTPTFPTRIGSNVIKALGRKAPSRVGQKFNSKFSIDAPNARTSTGPKISTRPQVATSLKAATKVGPTINTRLPLPVAPKYTSMVGQKITSKLPISTTPKAPARRGPQIASNMWSGSTPTFPTRIASNVIKALGRKAPSRVGQKFNSKFSFDAPNARTSTGPKISTMPQVATSLKAATKVGPTINTRLPLPMAPKYTSMVGQKITSKLPIKAPHFAQSTSRSITTKVSIAPELNVSPTAEPKIAAKIPTIETSKATKMGPTINPNPLTATAPQAPMQATQNFGKPQTKMLQRKEKKLAVPVLPLSIPTVASPKSSKPQINIGSIQKLSSARTTKTTVQPSLLGNVPQLSQSDYITTPTIPTKSLNRRPFLENGERAARLTAAPDGMTQGEVTVKIPSTGSLSNVEDESSSRYLLSKISNNIAKHGKARTDQIHINIIEQHNINGSSIMKIINDQCGLFVSRTTEEFLTCLENTKIKDVQDLRDVALKMQQKSRKSSFRKSVGTSQPQTTTNT
uniref:uncharacterized protein isoform X1 n=2 Tax=Myxine glutinosa TaxID=7769 RepID=UPI00358F7E1F